MKAKTLRLTARIFGSIVVAFWLFMGIGYAFAESEEPFTYESVIMTILIVTTTIGVIVAWKKEKIEAIILIIAGVIHSVFAGFAAGHNHLFAVLISGVTYIIIGTLFYLACQKSVKTNN